MNESTNLSIVSMVVIRVLDKVMIWENWLTHSGIKAFICNYNECNKKFAQKSHLNEDIKRHLSIKQFKCDYKECDQSFVTNYMTFYD